MRKIKFQGKRLKNGEWVCGCLTRYSEEMSYITVDLIENEVYQVDASTVGQYTGIKDKNGKEIYEGDIVCYNGGKTPSRAKMVVKWEDESLLYSLSAYKEAWAYELGECSPSILEVIGNIHDNPELLECDSP